MKNSEPKSRLELELASIRDVTRGLRRLQSHSERMRVVAYVISFLEGSRGGVAQVSLLTGNGIDWKQI